MENTELISYAIKGFLIGTQLVLLLIMIIVVIIDMKNTKKELKQTDNWIKSIENQMKFEKCILNNIDELSKKILIIENQLDIKDKEEPKDE